jgi:hypothetical protein
MDIDVGLRNAHIVGAIKTGLKAFLIIFPQVILKRMHNSIIGCWAVNVIVVLYCIYTLYMRSSKRIIEGIGIRSPSTIFHFHTSEVLIAVEEDVLLFSTKVILQMQDVPRDRKL